MKDYSGHESSQNIHSKAKKYAPIFPKELPSLPSKEEFELTSVLGNLKEQTRELLEALLAVSKNYEEDLNNEFIHKLDNEQKIQLKNKRIERNLKNMVKEAQNEAKKLNRVLDSRVPKRNSSLGTFDIGSDKGADEELSSILQMSTKTNSTIPKLCETLHDIDKKVFGPMSSGTKKYPLLTSMLSGNLERESESSVEPPTDHDTSTGFLSARGSSSLPINEENHTELPQETISGDDNELVDRQQALPESKDSNLTFKNQDDMTEEQFEYFISTSIEKYREKQEQKYGGNSVFDDEQFFPPSPGTSPEDFRLVPGQLSNPYGIRRPPSMFFDPVGLLKSTIRDDTMKKERQNDQEPNTNYSAPMKSPATVKQSLQTSHFKKLRINGLPMTSSKHVGEQKPNKSLEQSSSVVPSSSERMRKDSISSSFPRFSSALSEVFEDIHSLDSESNLSFYLGIENFGELSPRAVARRESRGILPGYRESISPTPKYQPSHHSLKPKRSILKSLTSHKIVPDVTQPDSPLLNKFKKNLSFRDPSQNALPSCEVSLTPKLFPGLSQSTDTTINKDTTVTGTILRPSYPCLNSSSDQSKDALAWIDPPLRSQNSDSQSIVSLSLLKEYLSSV